MNSHCFIVLSLLFISLSAMSAAPLRGGGWKEIKNINNPYVKGIAEFAVTEHNKQSGATLKLKSVVKGESQVAFGYNYRLVVAASDGSATKNYKTIVFDRPWQHYRNLTSFELVK